MPTKPWETQLGVLEFKVLRISVIWHAKWFQALIPMNQHWAHAQVKEKRETQNAQTHEHMSTCSCTYTHTEGMIITEFLPQLFIQYGVSLPNWKINRVSNLIEEFHFSRSRECSLRRKFKNHNPSLTTKQYKSHPNTR